MPELNVKLPESPISPIHSEEVQLFLIILLNFTSSVGILTPTQSKD
jgi:hypothetical protein